MASARPDPEQVEGLGPQDYPPIPGFDESTAVAGPIRRRDGVKAALDRAGPSAQRLGLLREHCALGGDRQQGSDRRMMLMSIGCDEWVMQPPEIPIGQSCSRIDPTGLGCGLGIADSGPPQLRTLSISSPIHTAAV